MGSSKNTGWASASRMPLCEVREEEHIKLTVRINGLKTQGM